MSELQLGWRKSSRHDDLLLFVRTNNSKHMLALRESFRDIGNGGAMNLAQALAVLAEGSAMGFQRPSFCLCRSLSKFSQRYIQSFKSSSFFFLIILHELLHVQAT